MRNKNLMVVFLLLALIFIGFGDQFLPKPLSTASLQTRTTLDHWFMGMQFWRPKTQPYARTQKAIDEVEKKQRE